MTPSTPNIVFVVLDTARAQSISPYNDTGARTPFLQWFAERNMIFEEAITPAPWTLPAHTSLFTGLLPSRHQVNSWEDKLPESSTTLAGLLSKQGYQTMGFSHNMWLSDTFGLTNGFDDFDEQWKLLESNTNLFETAHRTKGSSTREKVKRVASDVFESNPVVNVLNGAYAKFLHNRIDHGAKQTNNNIKRWLDDNWDTSRPFFIFANYLEPHIEYDPPERFAEKYCEGFSVDDAKNVPQNPVEYMLGDLEMSSEDFKKLQALYMGELDYLDKRLHELYQILSEKGALRDTLFVIVGDHGENIGENGLMSHMYSLHENLIRVPCLVSTPENDSKNVKDPIQTLDLFALCLKYAGVDYDLEDVDSQVPPPVGDPRGETISELLAENPPEEAVERETDGAFSREKFGNLSKPRRIIRRNGYKYEEVIGGESRLYQIDGFRDVSVNDRKIKDDLRVSLKDLTDSREEIQAQTSDLDENIESQLKDLGYL